MYIDLYKRSICIFAEIACQLRSINMSPASVDIGGQGHVRTLTGKLSYALYVFSYISMNMQGCIYMITYGGLVGWVSLALIDWLVRS